MGRIIHEIIIIIIIVIIVIIVIIIINFQNPYFLTH